MWRSRWSTSLGKYNWTKGEEADQTGKKYTTAFRDSQQQWNQQSGIRLTSPLRLRIRNRGASPAYDQESSIPAKETISKETSADNKENRDDVRESEDERCILLVGGK